LAPLDQTDGLTSDPGFSRQLRLGEILPCTELFYPGFHNVVKEINTSLFEIHISLYEEYISLSGI